MKLILWLSGLFSCSVFAVTLPDVFSDGMVLQHGVPVEISGTEWAGVEVTLSFAGQAKRVVAGRNGRWRIVLDSLEPCAEGSEMCVSGKTKAVFRDVLVGDVWLCSGQSNMYFRLKDAKGVKEAAAEATSPAIRILKVEPR